MALEFPSLAANPVNPPRAILLDLDNTAYAYRECHEAGLLASQQTGAALHERWCVAPQFLHEYDNARRTVKSLAGKVAAAHSRQLYFKLMVERRWGRSAIEKIEALHLAYWDAYFGAMCRDPDCFEVLVRLRARGVSLGWVTNFTTDYQFRKLRRLGLEDAADLIITSEEAGAEKPRPEPLRLALERLGVRPEDAWFFGDSLAEDFESAVACGVTFVWYRRGDQDEMPEIMPPHVVSSWSALWELYHDCC